ncbi:hypothetical protein IEQ34_014440 [Dendrobium chrysotoxum]|uniref:Uncharacterized protein n=1 Tax=Dendrobium chrysotoxum TaxID=161865 RepID=A0AAV7GLQ2_DENCH|nr:hypothetical protein IEQ34_014440 [Dendrobium chrysotoxum]
MSTANTTTATSLISFPSPVFCLEHITYRSHGCPKADHSSKTKIETCDLSNKYKPRCPVLRCKEPKRFNGEVDYGLQARCGQWTPDARRGCERNELCRQG